MAEALEIHLSEFEAALDVLGAYERLAVPGTGEVVYLLRRTTAAARIYTSVDAQTWWSRGTGEDAIRVVPWDEGRRRPLGKMRRVHRVWGWRKNLHERILQALAVQQGNCP